MSRRRPASRSGWASARSAEPFVVRVRSRPLGSPAPIRPGMAASSSISRGRSRRTSGSPPVIRSFSTPSDTKARATRSISSNESTCSRGRNAKSLPKTSLGMQYVHRKLQRSVTEIRRSRSGRWRRSTGAPASRIGRRGRGAGRTAGAAAGSRTGSSTAPCYAARRSEARAGSARLARSLASMRMAVTLMGARTATSAGAGSRCAAVSSAIRREDRPERRPGGRCPVP